MSPPLAMPAGRPGRPKREEAAWAAAPNQESRHFRPAYSLCEAQPMGARITGSRTSTEGGQMIAAFHVPISTGAARK